MSLLEQPKPIWDNYFFFIHRLKSSEAVSFRNTLGLLIKDGKNNRQIDTLLETMSVARAKCFGFFFDEKNRNLDNVNPDEIAKATREYLSFLRGLVVLSSRPEEKAEKSEPNDSIEITTSPSSSSSTLEQQQQQQQQQQQETSFEGNPTLKSAVRFTWKTIIGAEKEASFCDVYFEICSILLNQAIWFLGYSAHLVENKENLDDTVRKLSYDYLLQAAGIIDEISSIAPNIPNRPVEFQPPVLSAFMGQCLAQAEELTIGRAIKQGNSPSLISKLASDTSARYEICYEELNKLNGDLIELRINRFVNYFRYKHLLYQSVAYYYFGVENNQSDGYGDAVACAQNAVALSKQALIESKRCATQINSSGQTNESLTAKPVKSLLEILNADLAKFIRQNEVIAFQKVPENPPSLPPPKSLVNPKPYSLPKCNTLWTNEISDSFDISLKKEDNYKPPSPSPSPIPSSSSSAPSSINSEPKPTTSTEEKGNKCIIS